MKHGFSFCEGTSLWLFGVGYEVFKEATHKRVDCPILSLVMEVQSHGMLVLICHV